MPKRKSNFTLGFEKILNDPNVSPFVNLGAYKAVLQTSNQPISETLKYIGNKTKKKVPTPTDDEKSKQRIAKLEESASE